MAAVAAPSRPPRCAALLSAGYVAALVTWWPEAHGQGCFGSLAQVATLFSGPGLLLASWVHYPAFDLLVGRWEIDDSGVAGLATWWLLPCLALTFLFGPPGWLLYRFARTTVRFSKSRSQGTSS